MGRAKKLPLSPKGPRLPPYNHKATGHATQKRLEFTSLWRRGHKIEDIASAINIGRRTAFEWQKNLLRYGSIKAPGEVPRGPPRKLSVADKKALFEALLQRGWMYLDEMQEFLLEERCVDVTIGRISQVLKAHNWTRKSLKLSSSDRSKELRESYKYDMQAFAADDLVFIDESIFNEKTGWRQKAYAPIGSEARYQTNIGRGNTWSVLPAMTLDGYLRCTSIKQGYMSTEDIAHWVTNSLLPTIAEHFGNRTVVVVMDNVSVHVQEEVTAPIIAAGHLVKYLPPYSPDFNPIEMTFAVLKAWIKRHYWKERHEFGSFGSWLRTAINESGCDKFAANHFRHAAGGIYLEQEEFDRVQEEIRRMSGVEEGRGEE